MLSKYYRLHMLWDGDEDLVYNNDARIAIRMSPWKLSSGDLSYGSTITDDLDFGAGETITNGDIVEGSVVDNTSNLYWGIKGYFKITASATGTDGAAYLYLEESDDNTNWPSDSADFDITDLRLIAVLNFSTDAEDEDRAVNFEF